MIDARAFLRGLDLAQKRVSEAAETAMGQAGIDVLNDAIHDLPTVPFQWGTLRASGSVILARRDGTEELVETSEHMVTLRTRMQSFVTRSFGQAWTGRSAGSVRRPTPARPPVGIAKPPDIVVAVAFNTPYAARLHEHPEYHFTEPGSGGKYLERKLLPKVGELMGRVAARIRAKLEGAG